MRPTPDTLKLIEAIRSEPWAWDFYQALRHLDSAQATEPRLGTGLSPAEECIRLGQDPSLVFAPASLSSVVPPHGRRPARIEQHFFGMLGVNGPLPLHYTEHAHKRLHRQGGSDAAFTRFLDVFHHRFLSLLYRAWAQAQPTVSLDRPGEDSFATYVGALVGIGLPGLRERDALPDFAKLAHAGHFNRQVRNAEGLSKLVAVQFQCPVELEQFVGHWMRLEADDCLALGAWRHALGRSAVLGRKVWDRQSKFRLRLGPLSRERYDALLPGGSGIRALAACVHNFAGLEYFWDVRLVLKAREVPAARLDHRVRLGYTAWLGKRRHSGDAEDLILDVEGSLRRADSSFPASGRAASASDPSVQ